MIGIVNRIIKIITENYGIYAIVCQMLMKNILNLSVFGV